MTYSRGSLWYIHRGRGIKYLPFWSFSYITILVPTFHQFLFKIYEIFQYEKKNKKNKKKVPPVKILRGGNLWTKFDGTDKKFEN
jgi:hypothetical protein